MKKQKLLALAISAISTGILISCAKPADNNAPADKDLDKALKDAENAKDSKAVANDKQTGDTQAKSAQTSEKTADTAQNNSLNNAPSVQPLNLSPEQSTAYLKHVSKDIILPLYQHATEQSKALHEQSQTLCQSGTVSTADLATLRKQWLAVAQAWAKAEAVNFGPATENMAHLYINYFPDERGLVHKSVATLVKDNPNLNPKQFSDESAIVQGVPALEDILYSNDGLDKAQCNYVISASNELHRRLNAISEQWQKNGDTLLDTANPTTGMNQYLNGLLFHIENLKSTGIGKPLGLISLKKGHVPAHTAGESKAIISAKLAILKQTLNDKQLVDLIGGKSDITQKMTASIEQIETELSNLPNDISKAPQTQQQALYDGLTDLTKQIKRGLMPLLGVQVGFNSTDGD